MGNNNTSAISIKKFVCPKCLQVGKQRIDSNVINRHEVHVTCTGCNQGSVLHVNKEIRDDNNNLIDLLVIPAGTNNPVEYKNSVKSAGTSGAAPVIVPSGKKPPNKGVYNPVTTKRKPTRSKSEEIVEHNEETTMVTSKHAKYLDVLAYKLDTDGVAVDAPSVEGSDFNDEELWNTRIEDPMEDAAPQTESKTIMPREERLRYRNKSKIMQGAKIEHGHVVIGEDYIPIGIFTESHNKNISKEEKVGLFENALNNDSDIIKTSGKASSVYVEPGGCQWCPKVRRAMPFHVCGQYCIDGRRIPQTDKEFETYQEYLVHGGHDDGYVFCGYKDWLKREVDAFYPGWVEDHIRKMGGEISKGRTPYQGKLNLDPGQRRHLPKYPDDKLTEKRLQENKNHKYDTNEISTSKSKKKIISKALLEETPLTNKERYFKDVIISRSLQTILEKVANDTPIDNQEKIQILGEICKLSKRNTLISKGASEQDQNSVFIATNGYDDFVAQIDLDELKQIYISDQQVKTSQIDEQFQKREQEEQPTTDPSRLEQFLANNSDQWENNQLDANAVAQSIKDFLSNEGLEYTQDELRIIATNVVGDQYNPDDLVNRIINTAKSRKHIVQSKKHNPFTDSNSKNNKEKDPKKLINHIKDKNKKSSINRKKKK